MSPLALFSPNIHYVAFGILGLAALVVLFRRPLVGVGLLGLLILVLGTLLFRVNQPTLSHLAAPPFNTVTRIETDGLNIDVAIPPLPGQAPPRPATQLWEDSSGDCAIVTGIPDLADKMEKGFSVARTAWINDILNFSGQVTLLKPHATVPTDAVQDEVERALQENTIETLTDHFRQLRQRAPAKLAEVQLLLRHIPEADYQLVAHEIATQWAETVNRTRLVEVATSDGRVATCNTMQMSVTLPELYNALRAHTSVRSSVTPKMWGGRTWASILMAGGVVVMAGVILRASTHRMRRTIQT